MFNAQKVFKRQDQDSGVGRTTDESARTEESSEQVNFLVLIWFHKPLHSYLVYTLLSKCFLVVIESNLLLWSIFHSDIDPCLSKVMLLQAECVSQIWWRSIFD